MTECKICRILFIQKHTFNNDILQEYYREVIKEKSKLNNCYSDYNNLGISESNAITKTNKIHYKMVTMDWLVIMNLHISLLFSIAANCTGTYSQRSESISYDFYSCFSMSWNINPVRIYEQKLFDLL